MYFHVRFQGWKKTLKGAILRPRSSWWIWFVSRAFRVWTMHLWRLKKCGCVFKWGIIYPYNDIQWIKLVTLVETCCSKRVDGMVFNCQTNATDWYWLKEFESKWRTWKLSPKIPNAGQKCEMMWDLQVFWFFCLHAKKPSRSGFYTPKTLAHMFSPRSVAQYGVILQGHQTWLARKPSFSSMIFPVIYKPPWLEPFRYPFRNGCWIHRF